MIDDCQHERITAHPNPMRILCPAAFVALALTIACTSNNESPDQIRQQAANATTKLRTDTRAAAEGIREGWKRGEVVDINSASREKLATLPGLDDTIADRIIAHRPYNDPQDLVSRHVISRNDYDRIREEIAVKK